MFKIAWTVKPIETKQNKSLPEMESPLTASQSKPICSINWYSTLLTYLTMPMKIPTVTDCGHRLLDSLVVECWLRVREVPGSIPSQGPRHTKDVLKMVPVVPLFSTQHWKGKYWLFLENKDKKIMDKIWYRNPSKSEVIGRCGGHEKNEWPLRTDKSRTLKKKKIK